MQSKVTCFDVSCATISHWEIQPVSQGERRKMTKETRVENSASNLKADSETFRHGVICVK